MPEIQHDLPVAQAVAELRHEFGIRPDAFNNNPFDVVHDRGPQWLRRPPYRAPAPWETGHFAWNHLKNRRFVESRHQCDMKDLAVRPCHHSRPTGVEANGGYRLSECESGQGFRCWSRVGRRREKPAIFVIAI